MENIPNAELWEEFQSLKEKNYQLSRKLSVKNRQINGMEKYIRTLLKEIKELKVNLFNVRKQNRGKK